jgi:D-alanyl-D-alanine carboxypeptidase (penicillin-binding protein 5/6)
MENKNEKIPVWLFVLNAILVFVAVVLVFFIYNIIGLKKITQVIKKETTDWSVAQSPVFDNIKLSAKSAYVFDMANQKILFQKNSEAQLPLASLTKLMTALVAMNLSPKDSHITIRKEFLTTEGDSGLLAGENWKLSDLLDFSLVVSSNDGARSVASVIGAELANTNDFNLGRLDFIKQMNKEAQTLGLKQTYFINETGLDENDTEAGAYGSAEDVAKLMEYMLTNKPEILEITRYADSTISSLSTTHNAESTDTAINKIPGLIAGKTGYTALAGGNLAVAFDASIGHPIIVVVLGSTEQGRFDDVVSLVNAAMKYEQ